MLLTTLKPRSANIRGNGVLRAGNSVCREGHTGLGKGTEKASVGREKKRGQGLEARVRT